MKTRAKFSVARAWERNSGRSGGLRVGLALTIVLAVCHPLGLAQDAVVVVGSGSSVPAPLYTKWGQEYNRRNPGTQMRYVPIGTSEGIKLISHGSGDFGAGEAQLTATERKEGSLIEVPGVLIGIVPIYNLPGVHDELRFSGELLAEIFLGHVKNWDDSQIARLNPGHIFTQAADQGGLPAGGQRLELRFQRVPFQSQSQIPRPDRGQPLSQVACGRTGRAQFGYGG